MGQMRLNADNRLQSAPWSSGAAATAPEQAEKALCLLPSSSEVKNFMHLAALGAEPARRFVLVRPDQRKSACRAGEKRKGKERGGEERKRKQKLVSLRDLRRNRTAHPRPPADLEAAFIQKAH